MNVFVKSKTEAKEAISLLEQLGYKRPSWAGSADSYLWKINFVIISHGEIILCDKTSKEAMSIGQLRDLVVLKRNDVNDRNVTDPEYSANLYLDSKGDLFVFHNPTQTWKESNLNGVGSVMQRLNLIEKPMKEYLLKTEDGTYQYHNENHDVCPKYVEKIEIPEGAEVYAMDSMIGNKVTKFFKEGFIFLDDLWMRCSFNHADGDILWKRHTHPEELPFIDDDFKLNIPEELKGRADLLSGRIIIDDECYTNKSDGVFSLPKSEPCDISNWVEIREEGSLNDQYAEIEKVRQSHRTASEIADSALKHIRERAETYDQPTGERSAAKTAKAFNAITGKDITESEVWLLLQLLKDVRQWSREDYHQDSAEDCIAYAALKAESLEGGE